MASIVTIDENRITHVNGKAFFPIGARHMPTGANYKMLNEAGFNCVRWMPFGNDSQNADGLSVPDDFDGLMFYPYVFNRGDLSEETENRKRQLTELVEAVKNRPDMLCYEQRNEPAWTPKDRATPQGSAEGMITGSEIIRSLDPNHPIRIGHMTCNLVSTLRKYNPAVDIVGCNPYVVSMPGQRGFFCLPDGRYVDSPNQTISSVGDVTTKMMRAAQGMGVWMQLQAMSAENWYSEDYYPEIKGTNIYEHIRLYPSVWQMRFMAFNSIIRGATGLTWAMYKTPAGGNTWRDICEVIGELRGLHDVLADAPWDGTLEIEYTEIGFSDWTGVETLVKVHEGKPWILAANTQADPMIATFSNLPAGLNGKVKVVNEDRRINVASGRFTDRFQPYEVHIYTLE